MQYIQFKDLFLSQLGFGMMRLPLNEDGSINEPLVSEMCRYAISHGVNYFDTAHPYHGGMSEIVAGRVLSQFPRDCYHLASKYPGHQYADSYNPEEIFEEQLRKCQVSYFDFYLLHNVCESSIDVYRDRRWDIVNYFKKQRELGRIHHLGFSSHAEFETLRTFLDEYGDDMEFCQIQLNYLDWKLQKAEKKYELLSQRNIPIWVMEPVRGGRLAKLNEEQTARLQAKRPGESSASWAFRWLTQMPDVGVILSGMSNLAQMKDNIETFSDDKPLSNAEIKILYEIADELGPIIPCTACRYCCDGCPKHLNIPVLLNALNDARFAPNFTVSMRLESLDEACLPSACIGCGKCAQICPQHIDIPAHMKEFSTLLDTLPSWKKICQERAEAAKKLTSKS